MKGAVKMPAVGLEQACHPVRIFIEVASDCWFPCRLNTKNIFTFYGRIHPFASRRHQE